jgi:DNA-binding transcriptional ArsR family regulator
MSNVLLAPGTVDVAFSLDPVYNNLASLYQLEFVDTHPELDTWVGQAMASLSTDQMHTHRLMSQILYSAYEPDDDWPTFPAYLDDLRERSPISLRDRFLRHMFPTCGKRYASRHQLMDLDTYIAEIDRSEFDIQVGRDLLAKAHALLSDPSAMHEAIVAYLTSMWNAILAEEWERNRAFLGQVVDAFQRRAAEYSGQGAYQAIRSVTGRDASGNWQRALAPAKKLVFIPSPHIGPYLMHYAYPPVVRVIYGARLPPVTERESTESHRADLLVQLRALADETRLRILETLALEGELCAQEVVTRLGLSRSSASRHLSQLSATGYLVERQGTGKAKCYALNPERFQETLRSLERYAEA